MSQHRIFTWSKAIFIDMLIATAEFFFVNSSMSLVQVNPLNKVTKARCNHWFTSPAAKTKSLSFVYTKLPYIQLVKFALDLHVLVQDILTDFGAAI